MSYSTVADFIDYFGENETTELTNLENPLATSVDTVLLQKALDHAYAEVNSYLAKLYVLPLTTTIPQILKYDEMEIARFRLDRFRTREDVSDRYDKVIARLRDIAKGVVNLGLDQNNNEVETQALEPAYYSALPVFTMDTLRNF